MNKCISLIIFSRGISFTILYYSDHPLSPMSKVCWKIIDKISIRTIWNNFGFRITQQNLKYVPKNNFIFCGYIIYYSYNKTTLIIHLRLRKCKTRYERRNIRTKKINQKNMDWSCLQNDQAYQKLGTIT